MLYPISIFAKLIGKSTKTLQRWDRDNILKPHCRSLTNRRMYSHEQLLTLTKNTEV